MTRYRPEDRVRAPQTRNYHATDATVIAAEKNNQGRGVKRRYLKGLIRRTYFPQPGQRLFVSNLDTETNDVYIISVDEAACK